MGEVSNQSRNFGCLVLCDENIANGMIYCRRRTEHQAQAEGFDKGEGRCREHEEVRPKGFARAELIALQAVVECEVSTPLAKGFIDETCCSIGVADEISCMKGYAASSNSSVV